MKKQPQIIKPSDKPVTEALFLKVIQELREFISKGDSRLDKKMDKGFMDTNTKMDEGLKKAEASVFKLDMKMDEHFRELDEKAQLYRDQILTRQDRFVKRLDDIDTNIVIQGNDVEELKERVKRLERAKN